MHKLKFTKDKGSDFYKELIEKTDQYFAKNKISKAGNNLMLFKIRNTASSGMWVDTNRGRTKAFYSITNDAEVTIANITAIGTDGFSLDLRCLFVYCLFMDSFIF